MGHPVYRGEVQGGGAGQRMDVHEPVSEPIMVVQLGVQGVEADRPGVSFGRKQC